MADLLAQIGGPVSALGVVGLLLTTRRSLRLGGLALVLAGGVLVFARLVPDIGVAAVLVVAAAIGGSALVAALTFALFRWPWLLPVLVLACVPARVPLSFDGSTYNLLVPLYVVIAAATVVLAIEIVRGDNRSRELGPLAWPVAAFVAWSAVSLVWSNDLREGAIGLDAFFLPFTLLVLALARMSWSRKLVLGLCAELVGMALAFTAVGAYQWWTRETYSNPKLDVSNAYAPFFRVNSVFWDPSIYGRFLVVSLLACLVIAIVPVSRRWALAATGAIAILWLGLLLSFSQSSFAALVAGVIAAALFVWRRQAAIPLAVTAVLVAAAGLATPQVRDRIFDQTDKGLSRITSTRTTLVDRGVRIAADHPLAGVGLGGFKRAYADLPGVQVQNLNAGASHTTPITVAAETGGAGLVLYLWLVSAALMLAYQRAAADPGARARLVGALALTAMVVHSLFYAGFFEDPMVWGFLAMVIAFSAVRAPASDGDDDDEARIPWPGVPKLRRALLRR